MATTKFEKPMGSEVETLKTDIATLNSKIGQLATFANILNGDVIDTIGNMAIGQIAFYAASNNPTNQPSGCAWGSYLFIKQSTARTTALYFDNNKFACAYSIPENATEIYWAVFNKDNQ